MKTYTLPHSTRSVSSVVLGLMRIPEMSDAEIDTLYRSARDAGIDVFDHADIYGGERHLCEKRFGEAVTLSPAERDAIFIQSKVGIRKGYFDFSKEHILATVDGSLAALKTDYLDLLLLHRPDTLVEPQEVAEAFEQLVAAGKVRHFGVSNHTPGQVELLKSAVKQPLVANQVQLAAIRKAQPTELSKSILVEAGQNKGYAVLRTMVPQPSFVEEATRFLSEAKCEQTPWS